ncbi:hypothetical protein AXG93_1487s1120 [Marchantia polymorpha subsp. ruderalis]|uniref:MRH domain-containing protein n=1 Tax=Marchantia polymorpha subsp. ruderalis TaxID=1480154 RepID=A0A176WQJ4_MARPO|nr:hypothetical protein AXG93_1487s1120 [Marchantia polymorpha subsp. ruderalis]
MLVRRGDRLCMSRVSIVHVVLSVVSLLLLAKDSVAVPNLRGIAPQDERYFQTAIIKCKDGTKSFPQERLNDDFCDCVDGTDEPDCCDGSDEYDGKVTCGNTCWEAGEKSREKLKKKLGVFKDGSIIRKQDVEKSKEARHQHDEELKQAKREVKKLESVVDKLRADKEAVEKEEKRAREEKDRIEKEERERRERESAPAKEESLEAVDVSDEVEGHAEHSEITKPAEEEEEEEEVLDSALDPSNKEEDELADLTEEERGRVIASRWTGEDISDIKAKAEAESKNHPDSHDDHDDQDDSGDEADESHDDEEDDDYGHPSYGQDSLLPTSSQSLGGDESWWSKLMIGPSAILKMFGFAGREPVDISGTELIEAERIRKEFREASDKLSNTQSKVSDLENRLKQDFGKDGEFYSFYDKCFELKDKKYTYKVCPYKDATQVEGHSTTRLGRWQGFKDDYTNMVFEQGDKCWNGPERSLRVKMRCGTKLELRSVNEPSRCEYVAEFSTPALCLESRVQELEQQLVHPNVSPDNGHDEL